MREGGIFSYEWARDWIAVDHFDKANKRLRRVEHFLPDKDFSDPRDMIFGCDGSQYLLEYGRKWSQRNLDARLNRISYVADGVSSAAPAASEMPPNTVDKPIEKPEGQRLVEATGCRACHGIEGLVNGPSYRQIAWRYGVGDADYLSSKIARGGAGVWEERPMPSHAHLPSRDIEQIVRWIMSFNPGNLPREHGRL